MWNKPLAVLARPLWREAAKIALFYAFFSMVWIFFSDRLLLILVQDPERLTELQSVKAVVFVALTALLLFGLILRSREKLREALRSEDRARSLGALGQMASGLAHDFNNVLAVIYGMAELAREGLPKGDPAREQLQDLLGAARSGHEMVRGLMKAGNGGSQELQCVDLEDVWHDNQRLLRKLLGKGIVVEEDLASVKVDADPTQLLQVLMNFFVNANHAMPHGGRLRVSCGPGPEGALLKVSDDGSGMDLAVQASLFKPFFSTKGEHGNGLGLATVFAIVHRLGGRVELESEVGQGSTFSVHLPLAA